MLKTRLPNLPLDLFVLWFQFPTLVFYLASFSVQSNPSRSFTRLSSLCHLGYLTVVFPEVHPKSPY